MSEVTDFQGRARAAGPPGPEAEAEALIRRVGDRVRKARELKGIPRRVLSERSGVSPRYLAQLEAGEGNISIALLSRVATALDYRIEWLIGEEDPWTSDLVRMTELFRTAPADLPTRALSLLAPESDDEARAERLCLLGLRGAGKSTLGERLGARLGVPFVELNREIEDHSGMPVTEVMALYGQEGYRDLEARALDRIIATHSRVILAVAGGIVSEPDTFARLLAHFHTIWIKASPEDHMDRVRAQGDTRPMAGNPEAMATLRTILTSREALYDRAEARLDTTGRSLAQSEDDLAALVTARGFLG